MSAGLWAAFVRLFSVGYWTWHRNRYPPRVKSIAEDDEERLPRREMAEDAGSVWHPANLVVVAVGAMAVLTVFVLGTLVSLLLPLMIVVCFAVITGGGGVGWALLGTLAAALVIELTVVLPLSKFWDLSMDDEGPRESFCPPSSN